MIAAQGSCRQIAWALAAGALVVLLLGGIFEPGVFDVPPLRTCGTAPIDAGYWSAPIRGRMGAGRMEDYDQGLALSLALPQNLAGVLVQSLGLNANPARHAGSLLAAFSLGVLAVLLGGLRGLALGALLFVPFVFGHLVTDLGEGPAFAIVAWWAYAAMRGRWALAAALAGFGLSQKGCGLFLGVGCLAAVAVAGPQRLRRLLSCAAGAGGALVLSALAAWALFGDDPLRFLVRPWTTTAEVRPVPGAEGSAWLGHVVQAVFASFHGAGRFLAPLLLAATVLAPRSRPTVPVLAALAGALAVLTLFPDPQRLLPVVPLLVLPAFPAAGEAIGEDRTRAGLLLASTVAPQAAGAALGLLGIAFPAWALTLASLGLLALVAGWIRLQAESLVRPLLVASVLLGCAAAIREPRLRSTELRVLAEYVADRVPADAGLIASPVLGLRHRGTLWYVDFRERWRDELARHGPPRLFRVRATDPGALPLSSPPLPGYAPAAWPIPLGRFPYAWDSHEVDVWLEEYRREP